MPLLTPTLGHSFMTNGLGPQGGTPDPERFPHFEAAVDPRRKSHVSEAC